MAELEAIVAFLRAAGVEVDEGAVPEGSFLPGVTIAGGRVVYDPARLRWPGDLLHEAGHVAVTPASRRPLLSGTLGSEDEAPGGGEPEAIAWSWAAAGACGVPADVLFHAGGYLGGAGALVLSFSLGVYPGARGLEEAGLTATGARAAALGVPPYPHMLRWLRT